MGNYQHNIDTKGRLIIPAKFRQELGDGFIITRGMDGCLFGYSASEWQKLEEKLAELPLSKKEARTFVRFFYSAAIECTLDKQGRVNLPDTLIQYAKLDKECTIIGVSNRIEIWNRHRWEEVTAVAEENFDAIAEDMIDFNF